MIQKKIVEILHKINFARYQTLKIFAKQVISLIVQKWLLEYISHMMESMLVLYFQYNSKFKEANASLRMVISVIKATVLTVIQ